MQANKIFEHPEFGKVRTVMIDGEPWFVAVDVCRALSISNSRDSVGKLDNDEKMTVDLTDSHSGTRGGAQKISVVNEPVKLFDLKDRYGIEFSVSAAIYGQYGDKK